jgi:hypothetical protein
MDDEPPITLGLVVPGTAGTDVNGQPIEIFRCPACKEYINTSMTKCRFCGAPVDAAALARAKVNQRIELVCRSAAGIVRFWWVTPALFWLMAAWTYITWRHLSFLYLLTPRFGRFLFLPMLSLGVIGGLWLQVRALRGKDPSVEEAGHDVRVSLWLWILSFLGPPTIIFIARPDFIRRIAKVIWAIF